MATANVVTVILDVAPVPAVIRIARRDSFIFGFIFEDDQGPIDFTGDSFLMTANPTSDGSGVDLFSIPQSNVLDATGLVAFQPSAIDNTQNPDTYFFDVQWTTAGGDVRTLLKGDYVICEDISD